MKTTRSLIVGCLLMLAQLAQSRSACYAAGPIPIADVKRSDPVVFETDILPILQRNCLACHSLTEKQGDLILESARAILNGGDTGPAAIPGRADASLILKLAAHQDEPVMPPEGNDVAAKPLTSEELGLLKLWIDQGARGNDSVTQLSPKNWQHLADSIGPVYTAAVTPDGQYVATSRANQLFLYHVPTGSLVTRLSDPTLSESNAGDGVAHRDLVQSLAFSVDGDLLASGSFREVKLWRRPSDVVRQNLATGAEVSAVAVSPDRAWIATTGPNHAIQLFDTQTGTLKVTLTGHTDRVTDLKFHADGSRLVSSALDGSIRIWSVNDGALVGQIETPVAVNAIELVATTGPTEPMPHPEWLLVSGGAETLLRTWRLPLQAPAKLAGSLPDLNQLVTSRDGRFLAESTAKGMVRITSVSDNAEVAAWKLDQGPAVAMDFVVDQAAAAVGGATAEAQPAVLPQLVTTAGDGSISLWSLPDHKLVARWQGSLTSATAVSASADGKQLTSGNEDGAITLWNLVSPPVVNFAESTGATINRIVTSPSRKLAAVAGTVTDQPVVRVFNVESGQLLHTLAGHDGPVNAMAFSADNTRLVTGATDGKVRIWVLADVPQPQPSVLADTNAAITAVAFSPDASQVLGGSADNSLRLWNVTDGSIASQFTGHTAAVVAVGFLAADQPWSASRDRTVRFWNPADGSQTRSFNAGGSVNAAAITADGQRLAIGSDDKSIRIHQLSNGQVVQTLTAPVVSSDLSFSQDGTRLVSLSESGELSSWDTATARLLEAYQDPTLTAVVFDTSTDRVLSGTRTGVLAHRPLRFVRHLEGNQQAITGLRFHSNGQTVFSASRDGSMRGYAVASGQQSFAANHGAAINALAISPNEQVLATAGENNVVRLWQANGAAFGPQQLTGMTGPVRRVAFSADGSCVLAAADNPPAVSVFELQSGAVQQKFSSHQHSINGLIALPDQQRILSGDAAGVMTWEMVAQRQIAGHSNHMTSLAAVPTAPQQVISGSLDSTVRLWNLANGQQVRQLNHGGPVTSVAVRPDGQRIASGSQNHTARLWNINGQQIAEMRGDVRLTTRVARLTQQQNATQARLTSAKQRLEATEKDLPVRTEADQKAAEALTAANKAVEEKTQELNKAQAEKVAAEKLAIEASKAAQAALLAKLQAEADLKQATDQVTQLQLKSNQLTAAANAAGSDALKQAAAEAVAALQAAQAKVQTLRAAVQAPTQAAQAAVTAANQATQKVTETQKPYTDALAAVDKARADQNLAAQQQAIAARELEAATAAVPAAKTAHEQAEAALAAVKQSLEAAVQQARDAELAIHSIAFSPDGKRLATAGEFANVHTWDAETGTALTALAGHSAGLTDVLFLDDGLLVSGSVDQSVRIWDLNPGWRLERTIGGIDQPELISHRVTALDFSKDARMLLVAGGTPSRNGELLVFDVSDGTRKVFLPQAHDDVIYAARFSPDAERIATASADKYIRIFDVESSAQLRRLEGHTSYVLDVAWKGDGGALVSAGADNTIKVWNAETGDQSRTISNFGKHVTAVRYIGETDNIVSSCGDRTVRMHTTTNGGNFRNFGGASSWLHCVDITSDSKLLVAGSADGKLYVWNGTNGQALQTLVIGE